VLKTAQRQEGSAYLMEGPAMTIYQHIRHPHIASRRADRPAKVADFLPRGTAINRFNTKDRARPGARHRRPAG
jgi:hypothetical protein